MASFKSTFDLGRLGKLWTGLKNNNPVHVLALKDKLKSYNQDKALADLKAGTNVALLAFPQAMAYAMIAGLPVQYGIYAAAIAPIVAALLASSRFTMVGPSNATAVMVLSVFQGISGGMDRLACLSLLVCMVGIFLIVGSFLKVATLTQYVSRSVLIGYISGAALVIIANQIHYALGYAVGETTTFFDTIWGTLRDIGQVNGPTVGLTVVTFLIYFYVHKKFSRLPQVLVTLILCALIGVVMTAWGTHLVMVKPIPFGSWRFTPPELRMDWFRQLASGAAALAFLASLENTFMGKMLANRCGERIDVNQEMFALGAANIANGFFSGMPASGSLSRSALNFSSGAVTPMAAIFSGAICTVAAPTIGYLVKYVPQSSLAVVVIITAFGLIDRQTIKYALKATRSDAAVLLTTFGAALLIPLNDAIFLGVGLSIVLFLRKASTPHLGEYTFNSEGQLAEVDDQHHRNDPQISIIHVEGELFFAAADLFRDEIRRVCLDTNLQVVILRLKNARNLDATSVMALAELIKYLRETNRHLLISGASRDVFRVVRNSGLLDVLGRDNFFMASVGNPNLSTRNALKRASQLLGQAHPSVRIFYNEEKNIPPGGGKPPATQSPPSHSPSEPPAVPK